jgi:hypothetical protein
MKYACRALEYALQHPLTNVNEVPPLGLTAPYDYVRPTHASTLKKIPHKVPVGAISSSAGGNGTLMRAGARTLRGNPVLSSVGFESLVDLQVEQKAQRETLDRVTSVLQGLGGHSGDVVGDYLRVDIPVGGAVNSKTSPTRRTLTDLDVLMNMVNTVTSTSSYSSSTRK